MSKIECTFYRPSAEEWSIDHPVKSLAFFRIDPADPLVRIDVRQLIFRFFLNVPGVVFHLVFKGV